MEKNHTYKNTQNTQLWKEKKKSRRRKREHTSAETKISHRIKKDRQRHQRGHNYITEKQHPQNH